MDTADEIEIRMSREQFEEFCQILDNPPIKNVEAFMRMITKPNLFETQGDPAHEEKIST